MTRHLLRATLCALLLGATLPLPARAGHNHQAKRGDGNNKSDRDNTRDHDNKGKSRDKGGIFTATLDGTPVNHQMFDSKCAAYLAVGSGRRGRGKLRGLRSGEYYFQVTDPSGRQLLSTDPVANREFKVSQGVIVSHSGTHPTGIDQSHWNLKAITVGLAGPNCPGDFLDVSNKWSAYKVWVTPLDEFRGDPASVDNACGGRCLHGFVPSESKTAVFRVETAPPPAPSDCLTIRKEFAPKEDAEFSPLENWEITVTDPLTTVNVYDTDENGEVQVCDLVEGTYVVQEDTQPNIQVVGLTVNGLSLFPDTTYRVNWDPSRASILIVFQNQGF